MLLLDLDLLLNDQTGRRRHLAASSFQRQRFLFHFLRVLQELLPVAIGNRQRHSSRPAG